jgi:hypothetical protein
MSLTDQNPFELPSRDEQINVERLTVLTERLAVQHRIDNIEFLRMNDPVTFTESIIIRMSKKLAYVPGEEHVHIPRIVQQGLSVPATWWDAFKERHFDVLLRWFPVRHIVLQEAKVLQYEQAYEARRYLPDLVLPSDTSEIYRFQPLTRV